MKKIKKQILQNQILRMAKIIISINHKTDNERFSKAVRIQCKAIREIKSL
jgi:hypothetical protein